VSGNIRQYQAVKLEDVTRQVQAVHTAWTLKGDIFQLYTSPAFTAPWISFATLAFYYP